jgi:multiple sugar transport system substrate-binding protein
MNRSIVARLTTPALVVVAFLLVLVIVTGCGSKSSKSSTSTTASAPAESIKGQTITVTLPSWANVPKALLADFTKQTGVKVNLNITSWGAIRDKVAVSNAAGKSLGDVTEFDWSWTGQFGRSGWYESLDSALSPALKQDLLNSGAFSIGGHQYAVCYSNDFRMSAYNKTLFAKAGLAKPPATLDEVLADARILKQKGIVKYPIAVPMSASEGTATAWYLLTLAFGGQLFDANFKPQFDKPGSAGYKALQFLVAVEKDGLVSPGSTSPNFVVDDEFYGGRAAIILTGGPDELSSANDPKSSKIVGQAAYMPVPGATGPGTTFGLPEGIGVTSHSSHKAASEAFINWWMQPKTLLALHKSLGLLPCRTSVIKTLVSSGQLPGGDKITAQIGHLAPLFPQGAPTWYERFSTDAANQINAAAFGQTTVAAALSDLAKKQQSLLHG